MPLAFPIAKEVFCFSLTLPFKMNLNQRHEHLDWVRSGSWGQDHWFCAEGLPKAQRPGQCHPYPWGREGEALSLYSMSQLFLTGKITYICRIKPDLTKRSTPTLSKSWSPPCQNLAFQLQKSWELTSYRLLRWDAKWCESPDQSTGAVPGRC